MATSIAFPGAIPNVFHTLSPLSILRVLSPAIVLLTALCIIPTRPQTPKSPSPITPVVIATRIPRRALILFLLSLASLTFLLDGLTFVVFAVLDKSWPQGTGIEIGAVEGVIAFGGLAALGAWKDVHGVEVWLMKRVKTGITLAFLMDIAQVVLLALAVNKPLSLRLLLRIIFPAFRVLLLFPLVCALSAPRVSYIPIQSGDEEGPTDSSFLLPAEEGPASSTGLSPFAAETSKYGTFRTTHSAVTTASGPTTRTPTPAPSHLRVPRTKTSRSQEKEDIALDPTWGEIVHRLRHITPYLWPSKSRALQALAGVCILLVVVGRLVNFLVPLMFAEVVRIFEEGSKVSPWPYLFAYVGLRFLQSSGGLAALRDTLWAPVMQYSDREMSLLSFNHLLNLSFSFHTHRKTGEVLRILDRGAAINRTLELILFNIIPTFVDIAVALVFFCIYFEWTLAIVIFFVMAAYVYASVVLTRWRTKLRRQMNERDVVTRGIHTDCLLNYETVKYFGGEQYEGERYREAIRQYQTVEYKVLVSLNMLNLVQNFIITLGLLVGSMIVALRVTRGLSQPHEFVFFIAYLAQLYGPLNMLGYIYRSVNQSLVDTEKLLKLLNEPTEVNDKPGAPDLVVEDGEIEFQNVTFSYDGRIPALHGVSFKVPKRSSVALVGESGSGKSTILRLLYRFYDLKEGEGRILIDGKDVRDVTQASLRKAIGVVPQDPVLFNASIGYNIGYGKFGASTEEVEAAAKAAQMHERIVTFPDGYDTKVGERGIRLSGGEKQRVAIARTLLKNPPILLLDEATSALDTSTEKDIQKALQHLVEGRSSLSIAHRLSTIASADLIIVLKDGQIVEQGSHTELLAKNGLFASMWADQISSTEDAASVRRDVTGYVVDDERASSAKVETDTAGQFLAQEPLVDTPEVQPAEIPSHGDIYVPDPPVEVVTNTPSQADFPSSDPVEEGSAPTQDVPVVFPISDPPAQISFPTAEPTAAFPASDNTPGPVAFPSSDNTAPIAFPASEASLDNTPSIGTQSPGVTFQHMPSPPRSSTPDVEQDGKRRRTLSTQGIQRLTRRLSVSRQNSGTSPSLPTAILNSLRRGDSSKRESKDSSAREEGSLPTPDNGSLKDGSPAGRDSPTTSVPDDINKPKTQKDKKKDKKKEKKRKSTSQA